MRLFLAKSQRLPNRRTAWWGWKDSNHRPEGYHKRHQATGHYKSTAPSPLSLRHKVDAGVVDLCAFKSSFRPSLTTSSSTKSPLHGGCSLSRWSQRCSQVGLFALFVGPFPTHLVSRKFAK